ncbi:MAG: D-alanyl-D-alanine carboxypeptidase [Deltaproteobacteria bacterium]|nr:D-alanyl-D-alanine carboxypeptidase [Deltaproteobacteria bacterium]
MHRTIALFVPVLFALFFAPRAAGAAPAPTECQAHLLIDGASGEVIEEFNSHQALPPASMVKLMLAYTVMQRIKENALTMDEMVTASAQASKIGGSQVFLKQGEQFSVSDLLDAVLVQSANDASHALAEHIAGATSGFVEMMNETAKRLGMAESTFYFPHGLPPSKDQQPDVVSAHDFGILARAIIRDFPELLERTKISEKPFRGGEFIMRNHNRLVRTFPGADGLKTGFYSKAGFSVTATAVRNGVRMIAVVMGCDRSGNRDTFAAQLLSTGFARFRMTKLIDKGSAVEAGVPVLRGDPNGVALVSAEEVSGVARVGSDKNVVTRLEPCAGFEAPVAAGTRCGDIVFLSNDKEIARGPLVTAADVPEAALWKRAGSAIRAKLGW